MFCFQVLPRLHSFAPWHYFVKCFFLLSAAVAIEAHMHWNTDYRWVATVATTVTGKKIKKYLLYSDFRWQVSAVLGFFYALIGKKKTKFVGNFNVSPSPRSKQNISK